MISRLRWITQIVPIIFFLGIAGCATSSKDHLHKEIISPTNQKELAERLSASLKKKYGVYTDKRISAYLKSFVDRLAKNSRISVTLLQSDEIISASGFDHDLYLSRGLLGAIHFESELAFVIGQQIALIQEEAVAKNFSQLKAQALGESIGENVLNLPTAPPHMEKDFLDRDWFEPGGIYDFGQPVYLNADKAAILTCHAAKVDPRGAITYIEEVAAHDVATHILPEISDRMQLVREEIARLSPVRDALVKSDAFNRMQSQLKIRKAKH